ncbi:hypothetical protein AALO_G00124480 [Alosa alosa]|uniref:Shisa N-terminal domain-containing protein n=1 Tax=Alosa alosa TaxID=278164 RepID=A0AAV6GPX7_9TELE|nr:hypothetical protein AALO_G00124480 [Alosa alosa]
MSADCTGYYNTEKEFVNASTCPKPGNDARAVFCCGFSDYKYCCDDPNSFFPYEYGYMWWLRVTSWALRYFTLEKIILT